MYISNSDIFVHVEQELLTHPDHISSPLGFSGVCVARSLGFCVIFCRSLFVHFHLVIVLSVLQFTASDYPLGSSKFLHWLIANKYLHFLVKSLREQQIIEIGPNISKCGVRNGKNLIHDSPSDGTERSDFGIWYMQGSMEVKDRLQQLLINFRLVVFSCFKMEYSKLVHCILFFRW
jgi:hypothetical protein